MTRVGQHLHHLAWCTNFTLFTCCSSASTY